MILLWIFPLSIVAILCYDQYKLYKKNKEA